MVSRSNVRRIFELKEHLKNPSKTFVEFKVVTFGFKTYRFTTVRMTFFFGSARKKDI